MDSYDQFDALFERIVERFGPVVDDELDELRRTDPAKWLALNQALHAVANPVPTAVGSLARQAAAYRAATDYLVHRTRQQVPKLVGLTLSHAARHYGRHTAELAAAVDPLGGGSTADHVSDLLRQFDTPPPPLPDD